MKIQVRKSAQLRASAAISKRDVVVVVEVGRHHRGGLIFVLFGDVIIYVGGSSLWVRIEKAVHVSDISDILHTIWEL